MSNPMTDRADLVKEQCCFAGSNGCPYPHCELGRQDAAKKNSELGQIIAHLDEAATALLTDWNPELAGYVRKAKAALSSTQARADNLKAELVEVTRNLQAQAELAAELASVATDYGARAESAESSLAAAKERVKLAQICIGARMDTLSPAEKECAVNAAWWALNDLTGLQPQSAKPEFVDREIAALKTAGKE